jgi:hypothetical protein
MLAAATPSRSLADPFATASSEEYLSECPAIAILYEYARDMLGDASIAGGQSTVSVRPCAS